MKVCRLRLLPVLFATLIFAGCAPAAASTAVRSSAFSDEMKLLPPAGYTVEGAASVARAADHKDSPYFIARDYYNMKSEGSLTLLPKFKTYQQTTEWTCGPAAALMVLNYYGKLGEYDELKLAELRGTSEPGATSLAQMKAIFEAVGGFTIDTTFDHPLESIEQKMLLDYVKRGIPVMVEWSDWGGHWQCVIGYDTMGTESEFDDVLILADPYDTSDHCQDGYYVVNAERFFYSWADATLFPEGEKEKLFIAAWPTEAK